ncbi:PAS domain-containing protein [Streptomyces beigongshangae]|uniref:PAS domain-containing protein n=1 Tax=Streptomyces beigongshangae TaxID=2841597 RepID=UPI001C85ADF4|nr:PAS domain-containing protein [Streptomyces sp. REN17]
MDEVLRAASGSQLFEVTSAPYLVLDAGFRIQGINAAYLRATGRSRDELMGAFMFDAFPDDPGDGTATGVHNLTASLERVLRHAVPDDMGIQRYDIPDPAVLGGFRRKAWSPVNSPLTDADGHVVGALHHVEDVTAVYEALRRPGNGGAEQTAPQPKALLHHTMLAVARYERAARAVAAGRAAPGRPAPYGAAPPAGMIRRDGLWHAILHAARGGRPDGCTAAICAAAVRELPETDAAVITLHGGGPEQLQLAASSLWARRVEELQYVTGHGPSLTAFDTGVRVLAPDLGRSGARWPLFADAAVAVGAGAAFSYPLRTATAVLGTLTLYRALHVPATPTGPPADAQEFADIATVVLLADMDGDIIERVRSITDQDDIHTAAGVVAATQGIGIGEALTWLHTMAKAQNLPVADLARAILAPP